MAQVESIVVNKVTNGIILLLDNGCVLPHCYIPFASDVKGYFLDEVEGRESLNIYSHAAYDTYIDEIEHPEAVTVYTRANGWTI